MATNQPEAVCKALNKFGEVNGVLEEQHLGEGPHWCPVQQCLFYVDILGKRLLKYDPATKTSTKSAKVEYEMIASKLLKMPRA